MVNFFDNLRYWHEKRKPLLEKCKFYPAMNHIAYLLANIFLPVYFRITSGNSRYSIQSKSQKEKRRVIVSLTTFPARIHTVYLTIESLLHQKTLPDKIILCLSESQFPDHIIPKNLEKLTSRGLEIHFLKGDMRSHKKYLYAMKEFPEDIIITVDDDIFYRNDLVETMIAWHKKYPNKIIANWIKKVMNDADGRSVYKHWPETTIQGEIIPKACAIGCAGVLYPPHSLFRDFNDIKLIQRLCMTADDIWLAAQASLNHTEYVFTNYKQHHLSVKIPHNVTLLQENQTKNQQVLDAINEHYQTSIGTSPLAQ